MKHIDDFFAKGGKERGEKPVAAGPVSEEDVKAIMEHINDLFTISEEDERLIIEHVDDLFVISDDDERLIMDNVDELFEIGGEQTGEKSS